MNKDLSKVEPNQYEDNLFLCYENYIISGIPLQKLQNSTEFQYLVIFDKIYFK